MNNNCFFFIFLLLLLCFYDFFQFFFSFMKLFSFSICFLPFISFLLLYFRTYKKHCIKIRCSYLFHFFSFFNYVLFIHVFLFLVRLRSNRTCQLGRYANRMFADGNKDKIKWFLGLKAIGLLMLKDVQIMQCKLFMRSMSLMRMFLFLEIS